MPSLGDIFCSRPLSTATIQMLTSTQASLWDILPSTLEPTPRAYTNMGQPQAHVEPPQSQLGIGLETGGSAGSQRQSMVNSMSYMAAAAPGDMSRVSSQLQQGQGQGQRQCSQEEIQENLPAKRAKGHGPRRTKSAMAAITQKLRRVKSR